MDLFLPSESVAVQIPKDLIAHHPLQCLKSTKMLLTTQMLIIDPKKLQG